MNKYFPFLWSCIFILFFAQASICLENPPLNEILIVRGDGQYPPFEMVEDGKLTGLHIDLVNEVAGKMNIKATFKSVPWKRAVKMTNRGQADAITYISKTEDRNKFVYFFEGNILSITEMAFITLKESKIKYSGNPEELKNKSIMVLRRFSYGASFDKVSFSKKHAMDDWKQLPELLKRKRYDLSIVNVSDFKYFFSQTDFIKRVKFLQPSVSKMPVYIGFSKQKKYKQLAENFSRTMKSFKHTAKYQELEKKYGLD